MSKRPTSGDRGFTLRPAAKPTVPLPPSAGGGSALPPPSRLAAGPTEGQIVGALKQAGGLFAQGRFVEAEQLAKMILQFRPKQPDALHLLGLLCIRAGDPKKAEELIRLAIQHGRPNANVLVNLGNALRDQGNWSEAENCYVKALQLTPDDRDALLNRGSLYLDMHRNDDAIRDFEQLIKMNPLDPLPYTRAAAVEMDRGQHRAALALCLAAEEKIANPPPQLFELIAEIYERLSELDSALECAERALAIDPKYAGAIRIWGKIRRRQGDLEGAQKKLGEVDTKKQPPDTARSVHAELGQIYDRLGNVDKAFEQFRAMNEVAAEVARRANIKSQDYLDKVAEIRKVFDEEWVESLTWPKVTLQDGHLSAPIFMIGFPRSGTTLLDQILDAHPNVQVFEELPFLLTVTETFGETVQAYRAAIETLSDIERAQLRKRYFEAFSGEGADFSNKVVVNKLPLNIIHCGIIKWVFPEAKFILSLRHPADSVLSCFMQDFQLNASMANFLTLESAALLYDRVMTLWQRYRELLPLNVVEVRYENLIRDLRGEVEPALNFLGLEWNEAQADPAAHALARGTIRTPSYAQVTQPIYSSAADRWRRYDKYLAPVMPLLEKHIRYFGYSL